MRFLFPGNADPDRVYGYITAPNYGKQPVPGITLGKPWAGDLGCLDGPSYVKKIKFDDDLSDWLKMMQAYRSTCLFIAGADIVADAQGTLETYLEFQVYLKDWPWAYIAQDGAEDLDIPYNCAAVFIGGTTEWKCSLAAVSVIKRAQQMNKHIHIGRVNWYKRYKLFQVIKGSRHFTCDGTRPKRDGRERTLKDWNAYETQLPLIQI